MDNERSSQDVELEGQSSPVLNNATVFDEPALFVNWLNVQAFGDETLRVTFAESATADCHAPRGAYRMTLNTAYQLSEMLNNMVAVAMRQRDIQAEARRKMN